MNTSPAEAVKLIDPLGYSTKKPCTDRAIRIFVHGVFDLFHSGHLLFLQEAKNIFPETYVIAGVTADADTTRVKGLTVIPEGERALMLRGCKYVDEVIQKCEPVLTPEFMDRYHIDYFAHADTHDSVGAPDPYRFVKEQGKFLVIPRVASWGSTTEIISRIIRDRDQYVERQLQNGATREDMGL